MVRFGYQKQWTSKNKDKVKVYKKRWRDKNKSHTAEYAKKWRKNNPEKEKKNKRKLNARRNQQYKYIELFFNPFPNDFEVNFHHINNLLVIPIPRITHEKTYYGSNIKKHRECANDWLFYLYGIDFNSLMREK